MASTYEIVARRDGLTCRLCGGHIESWCAVDLDHILPLDVVHKKHRAGESAVTTLLNALWLVGAKINSPDNLQITHSRCNRVKRARVILPDDCDIDDTQIDDAGIDDVAQD